MPRKGLFYWIAMSDLKIQGEVSLSTEKAEAAFDRIGSKSAQMASRVEGAATEAGKAVDGIGAGAENGAEKLTRAESRMVASIKRTTQELQLLGKAASEKYEIKIDSKGLDSAKFAPYIAQLKEAEAAAKATTSKFKDTSDGFKNVGISAAQMQAALRGVPAQFTDIATSLASGQQPLTVLLQQGGQLKDMFGGIGPAAKALGGYVLGLVNPLTLAAGAVVGLAVAYNQGSKEADAYAKALILTGNAAGTTSNLLADMAARIGKGTGTQGAAAAALSEMAATGKIAAGNLEYFSRVALQMEKTVGQSAKDTAKDLAELGKSPLEASERLNEKYHYLTASVYAQIKALQDQGKEEEAATVAQKAYAAAFDERTKQIQANLGIVESAFRDATGLAKHFWDTVLNVGRKDTLAESLSKISESIAIAQSNVNENSKPGGGLLNEMLRKFWQDRLDKLKDEQGLLQENLRLEQKSAASQAEKDQLNAAQIAWSKEGEKYLSRAVQLEREITKARTEGLAAHASEAEIEKRIGDIRKKYSDIFNDGINSQIEAIKRRGQVEDEIMRRSIAQLQFKRQIGAMNEEDSIKAVAEEEIKAFDRREKALKSELELATRKQNSLQEQKALIGQLQVLNEQRLTREQQLQNDLLALDVKRNRAAVNQYADMVDAQESEFRRLRDQVIAQEDYNEAIGLSKTAVAALDAERLRALAAQKEERANLAELTDMTGELTEQYRKQAQELRDLADKKIAGAQKEALVDVWKSVDSAAHDAFVNILQNGKSAFERLRDSLKSGLYDLLYQMTVKKWIFSIGASISGVPALASAATTPNIMNTGTSGLSLFNSAGALSGLGEFGGGVSAGAAQLFAGVNPLAAMSSVADVAAGSVATAVGQAVGYLGPMALAAGAIYALAKSMDDSGTKHTGGAARATTAGGVFGMQATELGFMDIDVSKQTEGMVGQVASSVAKMLDSASATFGKQAAFNVMTAFADDTSKDGAWGALKIQRDGQTVLDWDANRQSRWAPREFADGEAGRNQYLAELSKSVRTALDDIGLPGWAKSMLDALGDAPALTDIAATVDKINAAQKALEVLGKTITGFAALSDSAVSALISAAGGLDSLTANLGAFYDGYYSQAEKIANVSGQVSKALAAVGLEMPTTRAEFRALVESQMKLGEAGAPAVAALLSVSTAFGTVADAAEQAAKAQIEAAEQAAKAARSSQAKSAMDMVSSAYSTLQRSVEAERKQITGTYEGEVARLRTSIDGVSGAVNTLSSLSSSLHATLDRMRLSSQAGADRTAALAQIQAVIAIARAGGALPDSQSISKALDLASQPNEKDYRTLVDLQREQMLTKASIAELSDLTDDQKTIEEKTLASLQDQLKTEEAWYKAEIDRLDATLDYAQQQIDQLNGINASVLSVAAAVNALQGAIAAARMNPVVGAASTIAQAYRDNLYREPDATGFEYWKGQVSNGTPVNDVVWNIANSVEAQVQDLYKGILGRVGETAGVSYWKDVIDSGRATYEQVKAEFLNSDEYLKKIRPFADGTNYIPKDRLALVHEGERIIPKADNRALIAALNGPRVDNSAVIEALERTNRLLENISAETRAAAQHTNKTAKTLDRLSPDGSTLAVKVEA